MSQTTVHKASHLGALVRSDPNQDPAMRAINEIGRAWGMKAAVPTPRVPADSPCRQPGVDPDAWSEEALREAVAAMPVRNRSVAAREYASDLCSGCTVMADCLVYDLLMSKTIEGVVAGMTSKDRRALLRDIERTQPREDTEPAPLVASATRRRSASRENRPKAPTAA